MCFADWKRSREFYVDRLGFQIDWEHQFEPGFPVFTQLTRDGLPFFLTEHTGDCNVGGAAYFVVDDVDALHREIAARGIRPAELPEDTPWQTREMNVIDPDGNRLRFASPSNAERSQAPRRAASRHACSITRRMTVCGQTAP